MNMKDATAASNLAAMSNVEFIVASEVARWLVMIKMELTTYVKERHEHGRITCLIYAYLLAVRRQAGVPVLTGKGSTCKWLQV